MSLEEALRENTAMMERLCSILGAVPFRAPEPVGQLTQQVKSETLTGSQQADLNKYEAQAEAPNESPKSGEPSVPAPEQSLPSVTYDDVKKATNNLSAAKGKEVTIGVLSRFGVKRATELTEAQWVPYIEHASKMARGESDV